MKHLIVASLLVCAVSAQAKDIVDTAVAAGDFKTLAGALEKAGLVSTLKGKGPFTVFAPTDAAFAKVPKADLDALLADKDKLMANNATGALIAVIGDDNNDFIFVGTGREFVAARDGALFLGINEGNLDDNSGAFEVAVEISRNE